NNGITNLNIHCLCTNVSGIFAGTFGGGICYTTNHGLSWSKPSTDSSIKFILDIVSNGATLLSATIPGLFKSFDNGVTWINIGFIRPIFRIYIHENDIFVPVGDPILNNTTLYVSHNDGGNWIPLLTISDVISDITSADTYLYFSTLNGHGVYNSTDNGLNWHQINEGFSIIPTVNCLGVHENFLFAGAQNAWRRPLELPLPVELSSFTSEILQNNVRLKWTTGSETNNSGFEIQRGKFETQVPITWAKVGFVNGNGTSNSNHNYEFTDKNMQPGRYVYRLKQIDYNGNFESHYLSGEVEIALPKQNNLAQNYPNPFNPNTIVNFDLKGPGFVKINIYGMDGKQILSLVNKMVDQGSYSLNIDGNGLSSGLYFYSLNVDGRDVQVKRMILLK
ncbi:MAG: T9SS type A sorting domain-containing protein, partial [Ignavibacteria bacterium]